MSDIYIYLLVCLSLSVEILIKDDAFIQFYMKKKENYTFFCKSLIKQKKMCHSVVAFAYRVYVYIILGFHSNIQMLIMLVRILVLVFCSKICL